jgi:LCP family protein required for cell wall assembly
MPPSERPPLRPTPVTIGLMPTQHVSATYAIPTVVPRFDISEEALTILLLGSDQRPDWEHWNTDAIQYVVIYPKIPSVAVLSIPRDLYVYVPQFELARINIAHMVGERYDFAGGGFGLLNQTLLYNLGITADYYVKVNFQGLKDIVDTLGGIDVPVHCRIEDYWPYPNENGEYPWMVVEPGIRHMDGRLALWYSRTRKTTSVFDREERQQQVLEGMWRAARANDIFAQLPTFYDQYGNYVETDLGLNKILALGVIASQIEPSQVSLYNIGWGQVRSYVTPHGGNVFLPIWDEVAPVIERVLLPPSPSRAARNAIKIEVWNNSGQTDWDDLAMDRLYQQGFTPIPGTSNGEIYPESRLQVFSEHAKGTGASVVQAMFGIDDANVAYVGAGAVDGVKLRLILGQDYQTCP